VQRPLPRTAITLYIQNRGGNVSKRPFAVLSVAVLLGVALRFQADPAAHAEGAAPSAVTFDWITVGDPGNACDPRGTGRCFGAVGYPYRIARHEVTNAQYAAFLNAKAASDPLGLYNTDMATWGGIARTGSPGSYTYGAVPGRENMPATPVSYFDALRFANWLHNGQGDGDTETGAYTLLGGTPRPSNTLVERNAGATVFLPTDAEWYKAAYYDTQFAVYYDYPAGTDTQVVCSTPTATPNRANCGPAVGDFTSAGSYPGSPSPNGTFDQGGNVSEWTDTLVGAEDHRTIRGGSTGYTPDRLRGQVLEYDDPVFEQAGLGFRLARLEEGAGGTECGNSTCESTEGPLTCPDDCPDLCGDGLCSGSEDALSCPGDCPQSCGDGLCTGSESVTTCWPDCGFCGDDVCDPSENRTSCAADCTPACGDGVVEGTEQCEAGVPLAASCTSLGFDAGTLACNSSTCVYDASGCFDVSCKPRSSRCSKDGECCSGDCRLRRCR
jgi:formylglycine-generating enzyme required for sulfatase activity